MDRAAEIQEMLDDYKLPGLSLPFIEALTAINNMPALARNRKQ